MSSETTTKPKTAPAFPAKEIEACIRDLLAEEAKVQADLHGGGSTQGSAGGSTGPKPGIDSLVVVEVLVEVETKVPFDLPESLVRAGGYDSVDEVVDHLMPKLEKRWRKHHEEKSYAKET